MPSPAILVQGDPAGTPLPVTGAIVEAASAGPITDRSGTITLGGTAQTLAGANPGRKYLFIQNQSNADLWLDFGIAAVQSQPSLKLSAGADFVMEGSFVSNQSISIIGAATGQAFAAKEG